MKITITRAVGVAVTGVLGVALSAAPAAGGHPGVRSTPEMGRPEIIGGTPPTAAYPFEGSLQFAHDTDPDWHTCGVTLISSWWAETNAHCVTTPPASASPASAVQRAATRSRFASWLAAAPPGSTVSDPSIYHIRFGSPDRLAGGVVRHVTAIHVHPSWAWGVPDAAGRVADIALLRLDQPVTTLRPARVMPARHATAREIGWGLTAQPGAWGHKPAPRRLSQLDVPLAEAAQCAPAHIGTDELCLGVPTGGGGPCLGDSGSAALQPLPGATSSSWTALIGSASRGPDASCGRQPVVYTATASYADWITRTELGLPEPKV